MSDIKNAFDYYQELNSLHALTESIKSTLEEVDAAFRSITNDDSGTVSIALSLAQRDLKESLAKLSDRESHIVKKLSSSYFA
jgi:hypothetical protein